MSNYTNSNLLSDRRYERRCSWATNLELDKVMGT